MTKTQHRKTAVALMFQNGISWNTKCADRDGFAETVTYEHYISARIFSSQCNIPFLQTIGGSPINSSINVNIM